VGSHAGSPQEVRALNAAQKALKIAGKIAPGKKAKVFICGAMHETRLEAFVREVRLRLVAPHSTMTTDDLAALVQCGKTRLLIFAGGLMVTHLVAFFSALGLVHVAADWLPAKLTACSGSVSALLRMGLIKDERQARPMLQELAVRASADVEDGEEPISAEIFENGTCKLKVLADTHLDGLGPWSQHGSNGPSQTLAPAKKKKKKKKARM
jgi:hypothetical protein